MARCADGTYQGWSETWALSCRVDECVKRIKSKGGGVDVAWDEFSRFLLRAVCKISDREEGRQR